MQLDSSEVRDDNSATKCPPWGLTVSLKQDINKAQLMVHNVLFI